MRRLTCNQVLASLHTRRLRNQALEICRPSQTDSQSGSGEGIRSLNLQTGLQPGSEVTSTNALMVTVRPHKTVVSRTGKVAKVVFTLHQALQAIGHDDDYDDDEKAQTAIADTTPFTKLSVNRALAEDFVNWMSAIRASCKHRKTMEYIRFAGDNPRAM